MKAILIIDVEDNTKFDKAIADITFHDLKFNLPPINIGVRKWYQNVRLKPMPHKFEMEYADWQVISKPYTKGWNDCLDEILGEEE